MGLERSGHFSLALVQTFPTADGWIFVMCMSDKFWLELTAALDPAFRRRTTAEWLERLAGVLPGGPVYDVAQALDSPFARRLGMVETVPHPDKPDLRVVANPIKVNGEHAPLSAAPTLGADNEALLQRSLAKADRE